MSEQSIAFLPGSDDALQSIPLVNDAEMQYHAGARAHTHARARTAL